MSLTADLGQPLMNECHRHGALTYRCGTAFRRAPPDVAGGKHSGQIRFQGERRSRQVPVLVELDNRAQFAARLDVAGIVNPQTCVGYGICSGFATNAYEQGVATK
jgi:hypothetical protein